MWLNELVQKGTISYILSSSCVKTYCQKPTHPQLKLTPKLLFTPATHHRNPILAIYQQLLTQFVQTLDVGLWDNNINGI